MATENNYPLKYQLQPVRQKRGWTRQKSSNWDSGIRCPNQKPVVIVGLDPPKV